MDVSAGDARNLLNALELAVESTLPGEQGGIHITLDIAQESIQRRVLAMTKAATQHYDTISAFIKSVRGSDPMLRSTGWPRCSTPAKIRAFILRRLIVLAGEDIGLADPQGLVVAAAAAQAFEFIGLPEGVYPIV
jgi:putative ATPase